MSATHSAEDDTAPRPGGGMKRRDLLLSGSLFAALALSAVGPTNTAQAQQRPVTQAQQQPAAAPHLPEDAQTSLSSWATMSAGSTSAHTIAE